MFSNLRFAVSLCAALTFPVPAAFAIDLDDGIKSDSAQERIAYDASAAAADQTSAVEGAYPDEAREVRQAIARHIGHANALDLEGYLADFLPERVRYPELDRDYAQRAMALKDLKLEIRSIEFQNLTRTSATVHTRQIAIYLDESGNPTVDDAIISYRWTKDANDQVWKISFTERKRLVSEK